VGAVTTRPLLRILSAPLLCAVLLTASLITPTGTGARSATPQWLATWGASPQGPLPDTLSASGFNDQTVRDIIDTSVGGTTVRVQFANTFGRLTPSHRAGGHRGRQRAGRTAAPLHWAGLVRVELSGAPTGRG
jgi:hypothetical protein